MDLSVVVPTLNGRDRLAGCLDALAAHAPDAEVVVVNGPSADGTTGMVRDRDDVDVLVETSDRTVNVARNAGIEVATGDAVALVDFDHRIGASWVEAARSGLERRDVVTGPVRDVSHADPTDETTREGGTAGDDGASGNDESVGTGENAGNDRDAANDRDVGNDRDAGDDGPERRTVGGRDVTYFAGGNVVFRRETLRDLDGFDEYLHTGGARDAAHRLANTGREVGWESELATIRKPPSRTAADGGSESRDWGWKYRSLAYRLFKNYGIRPMVFARTGVNATTDAVSVARDVVRGDATPSGWVGNGRDVVVGIVSGSSDGMIARAKDRSPARNPNGISKRADRAVAKYDERGD